MGGHRKSRASGQQGPDGRRCSREHSVKMSDGLYILDAHASWSADHAPPAAGMSEGMDVESAGQQRASSDALHRPNSEDYGCQLCQTQPVLAVPLHGAYCISNPKKRKMRAAASCRISQDGYTGNRQRRKRSRFATLNRDRIRAIVPVHGPQRERR